MEKKYYWLRMPRDFFERHDVRMIQRRLGFEGVVLYLRLILESIDHEGRLRFSAKRPYNVESLADAIDADPVQFKKLFNLLFAEQIIEMSEDKTIMVTWVLDKIGNDSASKERVRKWREMKKLDIVDIPEEQPAPTDEATFEETENVTTYENETHVLQDVTKRNVELELELELEIEIESKSLNTIGQKNENQEKSKAAALTKIFEKYTLEQFEIFWKLYPRKVSKEYAKSTWIKQTKNANCEKVIEGLKNSIEKDERFKGEMKFIPHPSSWLNAAGWLDDFTDDPDRKDSGNYFKDQLMKSVGVKQIEQH
jgi:hypothetical protein